MARLLRFAPLAVLLLLALPALAADGASLGLSDPAILPVVLGVGAAILKLVMTLLDKSGALEKIPPFLRPFVTGALAAALAVLDHLMSDGDVGRAILVGFAAFSGNELVHHTAKGISKARAAKGSINLADLGHGGAGR